MYLLSTKACTMHWACPRKSLSSLTSWCRGEMNKCHCKLWQRQSQVKVGGAKRSLRSLFSWTTGVGGAVEEIWKSKSWVEGSAGERPCRNPRVEKNSTHLELRGDQVEAEDGMKLISHSPKYVRWRRCSFPVLLKKLSKEQWLLSGKNFLNIWSTLWPSHSKAY